MLVGDATGTERWHSDDAASTSANPAPAALGVGVGAGLIVKGDRVRLPLSAMEELSALGQLGKGGRPLTLIAAATHRAITAAAAAAATTNASNGASGSNGAGLTIACGVLDFDAEPGQGST